MVSPFDVDGPLSLDTTNPNPNPGNPRNCPLDDPNVDCPGFFSDYLYKDSTCCDA